MILLALHPVDFGVLLLYLAAMLAIGFYFRREQQTSRHSLFWADEIRERHCCP